MPKFDNFTDFYASLAPEQLAHITSLVEWVSTNYPELEPVIAWNQPMFKSGTKYILGFMPTKKHTNLLTVTDTAVTELMPMLTHYKHGTRSIQLPFDWSIDPELFAQVISLRMKEEGLS
jgi:uncharacterized protein YdhG (YjbR/CyaY superfamily)